MLLTEQRAESRTKPLFRTMTKGIHLLASLLDVEPRHELFSEFADMSGTGGQLLPFIGLEEGELGGHVGWQVGTAEVEICDHGRKRIDIGREHVRLARKRVREAAFARLHLTD